MFSSNNEQNWPRHKRGKMNPDKRRRGHGKWILKMEGEKLGRANISSAHASLSLETPHGISVFWRLYLTCDACVFLLKQTNYVQNVRKQVHSISTATSRRSYQHILKLSKLSQMSSCRQIHKYIVYHSKNLSGYSHREEKEIRTRVTSLGLMFL